LSSVALLGRGLGVVALLTATAAVHDAARLPVAALTTATITKVQLGVVAKTATTSVTPTLAAASTAGTLLVATVAGQKNASFTAPGGWVQAAKASQTNAEAEIWYYANNPGGITSATFTNNGSSTTGQLSEWNGVLTSSPVDKTGTKTAALGTSVAPATSAATTAAGELAVTSAAEYIAVAGTATYTPGTGWTNLGNSGATSSSYQYTADYRTGVAAGTVSETISSSATGTWGAVVATFKPLTCTGGSLTVTSPASIAFPAVTLNGTNQTATASAALTPSDMSGSAAGWNVQATSTTFTNGVGRTLPTTATTVTGGVTSAAAGSANCDLPTNSVGYPLTLPAAATAPTAVKVYNAAANTGGGPLTLTLSFQLAVPASAYSGSYSSTWTFTIASGP
jgi:hypothetical protein